MKLGEKLGGKLGALPPRTVDSPSRVTRGAEGGASARAAEALAHGEAREHRPDEAEAVPE
jgi:hypothetical protein